MKAKVNGGTRNMNHEESFSMPQRVEEATRKEKEEEENRKRLEAIEKEKRENMNWPRHDDNHLVKGIRETIETIVIYQFIKETKSFVKYKPHAVRGYSKVCDFRFNTSTSNLEKSVSLYYEEGKVRYYYLWLSHEDDEKAIQCFKDHLKDEIKKHQDEIRKFEDLLNDDWKID